jgi:hypothetical protein
MPIILATPEADIRRLSIPSQPSSWDPILEKKKKEKSQKRAGGTQKLLDGINSYI